jgi:hypothetical protein
MKEEADTMPWKRHKIRRRRMAIEGVQKFATSNSSPPDQVLDVRLIELEMTVLHRLLPMP